MSLVGRFGAIGVALAALAISPATHATGAAGADTGLRLVSEQRLSPRLTQLRVFSPAMAREPNVRVLAPGGVDPLDEPLPVLWLLHGGLGDASDWTARGDAEAITRDLRAIVVMPDAGSGWYTDWLRTTTAGTQRWETFHLGELRPFIEARYRTRTDRNGRAIAGVSMGGFGAMHYAARHPDLFGFAAALSGALDLLHRGITLIVAISPLDHGAVPFDIFGDPVTQASTWRAHNPVDLAANLRSVAIEIRTGDGSRADGTYDPRERTIGETSRTFHDRLDALGIRHVFEIGPGTHTNDYPQTYLRRSLPGITRTFAAPR